MIISAQNWPDNKPAFTFLTLQTPPQSGTASAQLTLSYCALRPHLLHLGAQEPEETYSPGLVQQGKQRSKQNPPNRDPVSKKFSSSSDSRPMKAPRPSWMVLFPIHHCIIFLDPPCRALLVALLQASSFPAAFPRSSTSKHHLARCDQGKNQLRCCLRS